MTPRLSLRAEAKADIDEAFLWYEERSTGLGHEFLRALRATLAQIERNPAQFAVAVDDIRHAHLLRFPYAAYYVVDGARIVVFAVAHGRRHPRRWQSRR